MVNHNCETVTCTDGDTVVGDSPCVENSQCLADGDSYSCECDDGYVGTGTTECTNECTYTFPDGDTVGMQVRHTVSPSSQVPV